MIASITVAVPLHCSRRWVTNVVANVRALPSMVTEIIVSDRTCLDDAAEQIRDCLADDPRVVVLAEPSGLGWEEHFQQLLELGTGDLFMWMPHDDVFDPSWVPILAEALDAHPRAWLAYGRLEGIYDDDLTPSRWQPLPRSTGEVSGWAALQMMLDGQMAVPFRGVFRRREVVAAGLRMETATTFVGSDMLWVLAVALRSAIVYDDRTMTRKRFHPTSTSASWRSTYGDFAREAVAVVREHGPGGVEGAAMRWYSRSVRLGREVSILRDRCRRHIRRQLSRVKHRLLG